MTPRDAAGPSAGGGTAAAPPLIDARWRYVPLALFTIPMSFVGLGLALRRAATSTRWPGNADPWLAVAADALLVLSAASLAVIVFAHLMKLIRHPDQARADLSHPVRLCFAAALPMSLVLLAGAALPAYPGLAHAVWIVGTALYASVAVAAILLWQRRAPLDLTLLNPVWFLPIVGHVLVAHAGPRLGYVETSWIATGTSVALWIVVQTLLIQRAVFAAPLPARLLPTLTIQIGPAPLIFLALIELQPGLDVLMRVLYYSGIGFFLLLWLPRVPEFVRLPFAMPHWSFSFPLSALIASIFAYAERSGSAAHWSAGLVLLVLPILATAYASVMTFRAWRLGAFSKPEP